jgi:hypothetical protein
MESGCVGCRGSVARLAGFGAVTAFEFDETFEDHAVFIAHSRRRNIANHLSILSVDP